MKLTNESQRIEKAHYILQKLEDEVVGAMTPVSDYYWNQDRDAVEKVYAKRLEHIHDEVWKAIKCLNEAYDKDA